MECVFLSCSSGAGWLLGKLRGKLGGEPRRYFGKNSGERRKHGFGRKLNWKGVGKSCEAVMEPGQPLGHPSGGESSEQRQPVGGPHPLHQKTMTEGGRQQVVGAQGSQREAVCLLLPSSKGQTPMELLEHLEFHQKYSLGWTECGIIQSLSQEQVSRP